jgi:hypothetical protein
MSIGMLLTIDGVESEARDKAHGEEIGVLAESRGTGNHGSAQVGGRAGCAKVSLDYTRPDLNGAAGTAFPFNRNIAANSY